MNDELTELFKKKKKLDKGEENKAKTLIREELLQRWNKDCKTESDRRVFQILSSELLAEIIAPLWSDLNQNLLLRWFTDLKEGERGLKCGVRVAVSLLSTEETPEKGWQLFHYLISEGFKVTNKKAQKAFISSLFNKDEFVLKEKFPLETTVVSAICEPLWESVGKKSSQTKLNVASWIGKTLGKNEKRAFSKLFDDIRKADEVKLCKSVTLDIYDDFKVDNFSSSTLSTFRSPTIAPEIKAVFNPMKALEDLKIWMADKNIEIEKLLGEKRVLESEVKELKPQLERLRDKCDRKGEEIDNLKEKLSEGMDLQKDLVQKNLHLSEELYTLKKEIESLRAKYNETIEHLNLKLDKIPQIRVDEFKSKLATYLRKFINVYAIPEDEIRTDMERLLLSQILQMLELLGKEGIKIKE